MAARKQRLVVREAFTYDDDGTPTVVHAGETIESTHPLVKGREALFEPVDRTDHEAPKRR